MFMLLELVFGFIIPIIMVVFADKIGQHSPLRMKLLACLMMFVALIIMVFWCMLYILSIAPM